MKGRGVVVVLVGVFLLLVAHFLGVKARSNSQEAALYAIESFVAFGTAALASFVEVVEDSTDG